MANDSEGLARPTGERSSLISHGLLAFLADADPKVFEKCRVFVEHVYYGEVKIPNVSTNRAKELLNSFIIAEKGLPNEARVKVGLEPKIEAPLPTPPAPEPVAPEPVAAAPAPRPQSRTMGDTFDAPEKIQEMHEELNFVARSAESFLKELKDTELERDLPAPMVRVVSFKEKFFLLAATAKFTRDFGTEGEGVDQIGMAIDHFKPDEHPLRVKDASGAPLVRSNRDRRSNTDPERVFWVRAVELKGEALVRFWLNPCHRPGDIKKRANQNRFYAILEDGSVNDLTEEEYKALSPREE